MENVPMTGEAISKEDKQWAMLAHLLTLVTWLGLAFANIVAPLVIWQIKKDELPFTVEQAKEALNFQISMTIYIAVSTVLCFVLIGFVLLPLVIVLDVVFTIIAAVKASEGVSYRYPLTIRFVK
ncbi:MAG: DUF4870 domain-containing protein [Verrucomicrobiales bacterium]